jgi:hypothetical protein
MYIVLADRILILDDVVGNKSGGGEFAAMSFFELLESAQEYIDEHGLYSIFICQQVEFFNHMGDGHSEPCFADQVLHDVSDLDRMQQIRLMLVGYFYIEGNINTFYLT